MNKKRDSYREYKIKNFLDSVVPKRKKKHKHDEIKARYSRSLEAPMHLAIVLDGIVEDIIHCDERFGILMTSDPLIVEIPDGETIELDWLYDSENNRFYKREL